MNQLVQLFLLSTLLIGCQSRMKQKPFVKTQEPSSISIQSEIDGIYTFSEGNDCALMITIESNQYHLTTDHQEQNGTIHYNESEGIITFNDFYDIDSLNTLSASLQENELTIQNYGNSQNPFTFFEECGEKYLILEKQW